MKPLNIKSFGRLLVVGALIIAAPVVLSAETFDSPVFQPVTAEVLAQGNSFTGVARGYNSLFTNPAGLARTGGSFTLLSISPMSYFFPSQENTDALSTIANDPAAAVQAANDLILENGLGAAARVGALGIAGRRFGFGVVYDLDVYGRGGITALGTTVDVTSTLGVIGGFAWPFAIGDNTLNVGGTVKLLNRTEARDVGLVELLQAADSNSSIPVTVLSGPGLGFDIGALYEFGTWSAGVSFRDLFGTRFRYTQVDELSEPGAIFTGIEGGTEVSDTYRIPMSMNLGFAWDPEPEGVLGFFFNPMIHFDYQHVFYTERDPSFWTRTHIGLEARVMRFLKFRAGLNQGYGTVGLGAKLLFVDLNVAYFAREIGDNVGTKPNQGLALEAAIRF